MKFLPHLMRASSISCVHFLSAWSSWEMGAVDAGAVGGGVGVDDGVVAVVGVVAGEDRFRRPPTRFLPLPPLRPSLDSKCWEKVAKMIS